MRTSATEEEDGGACGFSEGFRSSPNPFICYRYFYIHIVAVPPSYFSLFAFEPYFLSNDSRFGSPYCILSRTAHHLRCRPDRSNIIPCVFAVYPLIVQACHRSIDMVEVEEEGLNTGRLLKRICYRV